MGEKRKVLPGRGDNYLLKHLLVYLSEVCRLKNVYLPSDLFKLLKQASRGSLHKAAISGQYEMVKMLLESGDDVNQRDQV